MKNLLFAFLISLIGPGVAFAQDLIVTTAGAPVNISGGTAGVGLEAGFGIRLKDASKLYLNLSLLSGTITQVNIENGGQKEKVKLEKEEYESLSRLEVTLGLVFGH
ncbi:MAG: hypothetical protein BGO21_13420 [Dyadobacter sp. 50-39]|uniref:hypothetical protein n=1 Tax=Dyadobacter sp. 50-39 TaxID=1895756 RepID=UPI00095DDC95|nr:hypothetical protein [Dyadobacter sp. 50-39]OJV17461.1 MAG: hypothetical protein BGO21_13420 [Dyadobacter sp. 50-39]